VPPVAGLLLTGGASRRLGVAKATLLLDGERLVDRVARVLAGIATTVVEVGPGYSHLEAVREEPPGSGPLAALVAGAAVLATRHDDGASAVLVLAVDLPFVDAALLTWLASHPAPGTVVPVVGGLPQPLCARYAPDALAAAAELVAAGERSMRALLRRVDVHEALEEEWSGVATARTFSDVDTPEDANAFGLVAPG
jgi:molybdopterin-guanine dinucleotide biosynthesis protein A